MSNFETIVETSVLEYIKDDPYLVMTSENERAEMVSSMIFTLQNIAINTISQTPSNYALDEYFDLEVNNNYLEDYGLKELNKIVTSMSNQTLYSLIENNIVVSHYYKIGEERYNNLI